MLTFPDSQLKVRKFKIFLNLWNPFSFPIAVLWWSSLYKSYKNSTALVWLSEYWNIHWYFYCLLSPYPSSLSAVVSGVLNTLWNGTDLFPRLAVLLCLLKDESPVHSFDRWENWATDWWRDMYLISEDRSRSWWPKCLGSPRPDPCVEPVGGVSEGLLFWWDFLFIFFVGVLNP